MLLLHRHDQSMSLLNGFVIVLGIFAYCILMYLLVCKSINRKSIYYWNTQYRYFWFWYFRCGVSRHNKIIFLFNFSLTRPPKKNKQQIESYLHPGKNPVNNNIYLMDDFQPSSLLHLTKLDIRQHRNLFSTSKIGS